MKVVVSGMRAPATHHAVVMDRYGPPEVLGWREVASRPPARDEVGLRTIASPVNRADLEIRRGIWPVRQDDPFPYVPGLETLGTVEAVGDGVLGWVPGQRAITMMQRLGGIHGERPGGYAEYVTVPAASLAAVPEDVDPLTLAALGLTAVTALEGLRRLALQPGHRLVVLGASGGVGSAAVSLARHSGAKVIGVVSRAEQVEYVHAMGATEVVVLAQNTSSVDALGPGSVDAVLETLGMQTFRDSVALLRPGGRLCLVGALTGPDLRLQAWDLLQDLHLTGYSSENLTGEDLRRDIAEIVTALRSGELTSPEHRTFPLRAAAQSHRLLERGGVVGRLLLVPDGS